MHLLRLIKINSAKISALSLINLVGMSVFCVALFDCNILISFRISTFSTNEKLKSDLEVQFSLMAIIFGWALWLHNGFNDWITDIFRCSVNFVKLWNVKIGYVTTLAKTSFKTFAVCLSLLLTLSPATIVIFTKKFLLLQTFFLFKLLKKILSYFLAKVLHTNFLV